MSSIASCPAASEQLLIAMLSHPDLREILCCAVLCCVVLRPQLSTAQVTPEHNNNIPGVDLGKSDKCEG